MKKILYESKAIQIVIGIIAVGFLLSLWPLRIWNERVTTSVAPQTGTMTGVINEQNAVLQTIVAQYDHMDTIDVYLSEDSVGEHFYLRILDEQCDPEAFLEAQRVIYRRACGTKRIRSAAGMNAAVVRMNHAVGLSFAGRHKEAVEELQAILALPVKKNKDYLHSLCHVNLAMFLARRGEDGDIAAAREHIRKAGEHLKGIGQSNSALSGEIVRAEYMADTAEGKNSEAALEYFSKNLKNASVVRAEAAYRYQLALIYRRQGDNNSERTHLEFVAQTAPKAYIGKQAAARLAELSA